MCTSHAIACPDRHLSRGLPQALIDAQSDVSPVVEKATSSTKDEAAHHNAMDVHFADGVKSVVHEISSTAHHLSSSAHHAVH